MKGKRMATRATSNLLFDTSEWNFETISRAYDAMEKGFHDHGIMLRITGDTIALSPPLIIKEEQIGEIFEDKLPKVLAAI